MLSPAIYSRARVERGSPQILAEGTSDSRLVERNQLTEAFESLPLLLHLAQLSIVLLRLQQLL